MTVALTFTAFMEIERLAVQLLFLALFCLILRALNRLLLQGNLDREARARMVEDAHRMAEALDAEVHAAAPAREGQGDDRD